MKKEYLALLLTAAYVIATSCGREQKEHGNDSSNVKEETIIHIPEDTRSVFEVISAGNGRIK